MKSVSVKCSLMAGIGGMMPTLSRLASVYVTNPETPLPEIGLLFGLSLFFIIGAVLAYAFGEKQIKQAFFIGVCAPGIITNIVAGVSEAKKHVDPPTYSFKIINEAYAKNPSEIRSDSQNLEPKILDKQLEPIIIDKRTDQNKPYIIVGWQVEGGDRWALSEIRARLFFERNHKPSVLASVYSGGYRYSEVYVTVPDGSNSLKLFSSGRTIKIAFPSKPFISASLLIHISARGKMDFLWALGARRDVQIDKITAEFTEVNLKTEKKILISDILNKILLTQKGEEIGIVKNVEIDQDNELQLIVSDRKHLFSSKDTIKIPLSYIIGDGNKKTISLNISIDRIKNIWNSGNAQKQAAP